MQICDFDCLCSALDRTNNLSTVTQDFGWSHLMSRTKSVSRIPFTSSILETTSFPPSFVCKAVCTHGMLSLRGRQSSIVDLRHVVGSGLLAVSKCDPACPVGQRTSRNSKDGMAWYRLAAIWVDSALEQADLKPIEDGDRVLRESQNAILRERSQGEHVGSFRCPSSSINWRRLLVAGMDLDGS